MKDWGKSFGVREESTVPYTSHQNGIAERGIQITENNIRAMYKDSGMGMIFWDEAAKMDAHIRNHTTVGPEVDGSRITSYEDWRKEKFLIDYFCVWGYKCYVYNNPKSLPAGICQDKFINYKKVGIFLGYSDKIDY